MLMHKLMVDNAKKSALLTADNESKWKNVAGTDDVAIYWDQYLYNCSNAEEVIYKNAKPQFTEVGPFKYR